MQNVHNKIAISLKNNNLQQDKDKGKRSCGCTCLTNFYTLAIIEASKIVTLGSFE